MVRGRPDSEVGDDEGQRGALGVLGTLSEAVRVNADRTVQANVLIDHAER